MKRLFLLLGLALAAVLPLAAQTAGVQFADGQVEVQRGAGWSALYTGDELPADAVVRLAAGGYLEIARGDHVVTLSRGGTYRVADLLKSAGAASSWGMGSVVNSKLVALGSGARGRETQGTQMGVRGASQGGAAVTWIEDEAGELIKRGIALLAESRAREALEVFGQAAESATEAETEAAGRFYAAYAHDQLGEQAQAVRLIARVSPPATADYYRDFVLLKGRLLIEGAAPAEALSLLDAYLAASPTGEGAQAAEILAAFACRSLGDGGAAARRLEAARDLAPASELGRRAAALMAEIR